MIQILETLGTVSPDKSRMFKIAVHDEDALNSFLDIFDEIYF